MNLIAMNEFRAENSSREQKRTEASPILVAGSVCESDSDRFSFGPIETPTSLIIVHCLINLLNFQLMGFLLASGLNHKLIKFNA